MDITVRPADPAEYESVGELVAGAYLVDGLLDFGESDSYLVTLRDAPRRAEQAELLVAVDQESGGLLGSVTFTAPGTPYAEIGEDGEAEFRMLGVAPEARGRGVGEALVRACLDRARTLGAHRVVLSSSPRMAAAHRLYERLGFIRTPERDWHPLPGFTLWTFALDL